MTKIEGLSLLDYVEDVSKADIGTMNMDQQETNKPTHYHWENPWGPLSGPQVKCGPIIPSHCGGHTTLGKLESIACCKKPYCSG